MEMDAFVETRVTDFDLQQKKVAGDGVVTGYGTLDGRLVYVSSQDFTVIGGSLGEMHAKKITKVMDMAMKMGAPFISINDSGGARIEEGIDALGGSGRFSEETRWPRESFPRFQSSWVPVPEALFILRPLPISYSWLRIPVICS